MRLYLIAFLFSAFLLSCSGGDNQISDIKVVKDVHPSDDNMLCDSEDISDIAETEEIQDVQDDNFSEDITDSQVSDIEDVYDSGPENMLNISLIMQLENSDILSNKSLFDAYVTKIDRIAGLFEKYNARISFEAKEIVSASVKYGSDFLNQLISRGHSINIHADSGTRYGMTFSDFVQELRDKKDEMEKLSIEPLAVSGVCSQLDWVAASFNVGFKYITSITAFCLKSLPLEEQPDFVKNCLAPFDCQQAYPFENEKRLFPWRAKLGSDWRTDDPEGLMVLMPSFSRLACLDEEFKSPGKNIINCTFDNFDIERSLDIIDNALLAFDKSRMNVIIFIWSFGSEPDKTLFEKWLSEINYYVKKQKIRWSNTDEIFDEYDSKSK